jgi:HK97 family phage prohead protease
MEKLFTTGKVKQVNLEKRTLTAYASTADLDRDGDVILPDAWRKTIQQNESVPLMWAHEYNIPPVGRASAFAIDDKGLRFEATFAKTAFAEEIWQLYSDGFLDSFSVGFRPIEWEDGNTKSGAKRVFKEAELLEISSAPIPANPHARIERGIPVIAFKSAKDFEAVATETVTSPSGQVITVNVNLQREPVATVTDNDTADETKDEGESTDSAQVAGNATPENDDDLTPDEEAALAELLSNVTVGLTTVLGED